MINRLVNKFELYQNSEEADVRKQYSIIDHIRSIQKHHEENTRIQQRVDPGIRGL